MTASLLALCAGALGCGTHDGAPAGTRWLSSGPAHWRGWIELVPAIQTPRFEDGRDHTTVYARFPAAGEVTLADPADRTSLRVPVGAELDRVERFTVRGVARVADVRGTRFDAQGEVFSAWRPYDATAAQLFGVSWVRADEPPDDARRAMRGAMAAGHGSVLAGMAAPTRIARYERLLRCAGCHEARQPERLGGTDGGPRRPTDASGLYSLLASLSDTAMVDTYRPIDPNQGSPFVTYAPPRATLDVARALRRGDPHARSLCAARRRLAPFLAASVRRAYRVELQACEVDVGGV